LSKRSLPLRSHPVVVISCVPTCAWISGGHACGWLRLRVPTSRSSCRRTANC